MSRRPFALVPAAYVLLLREAPAGHALPQVLLQLRQGTGYMDGYWACGAAGHVEDGESVLEAAVREAGEELGVVVDPADLEPLTGMHRTNDPGGDPREQRVDWFFTLRRWRGEPAISEAARTASLAWYPLDDLPRVPPHERHVMDLLAGQLRGGASVPAVTVFGFEGRSGL
ncbi:MULTISPECIES: NUDIX domain-containing protein [unclassified Actinomyces]|uniref:NUDIX domain-containing protein n=1 Tax=unclassified Actinomyces TaxID=2609248 RepID=UPI002018304D|nr:MULTISPECIES: NUDIX domain-containing protein [unclassified Actinomyces]MCL3776886.1 NUDIX domain-containing protein [Actinomyces sp. AC-20-1]MCL3790804.1 NUDIX domain-containing protein [Actinomyces sp. 187325]MCL3792253.1 NUDIX domain-containing protein [Actinomyces sp. 186855]MCL3795298.1 NUDIX domain-containing protein [Actinomyces sp. 217892]